jgi:hypothetical protein
MGVGEIERACAVSEKEKGKGARTTRRRVREWSCLSLCSERERERGKGAQTTRHRVGEWSLPDDS